MCYSKCHHHQLYIQNKVVVFDNEGIDSSLDFFFCLWWEGEETLLLLLLLKVHQHWSHGFFYNFFLATKSYGFTGKHMRIFDNIQ